jgi:ABC-type transporter MlaC component
MKRDSLITPFRLTLLVAGLLLVGAVLWLGLRPSRHERRGIEPVETIKSVETIEPETLSLPPSGASPIADLKHYNAALKKLLLMPSPSSSSDYSAERAEMRRIVRILLLVSLPLDFEDLVRRALAGHWDEISPEQRTEIVGVVRSLAERNLSKQLYEQPNYDLRFTKETVTGSEATVAATLEWPYQGKRVSVLMAWKLLYKRGSWLVYDVITDQESMLENYRAEFDKIISQKSFGVLLERMKKHLKKIE